MVKRQACFLAALFLCLATGDGVHAGGSRSNLDCHPRSRAAHFRANRMRSRAFSVGLCPYPPSLGECLSPLSAMASHLSHAMECPADFLAANCAFLGRRGVGVLVDATTARACSTPGAACASTSCRARTVSTPRDYPHKEPHWRTHLRVAGRALRTDHC